MEKINLEKEEKCGFIVDVWRKEVWQKELEILDIILEICNKYNINYTMIAGSLLGTIRHNGIIPWDDDIDVAMYRSDYEKFLDVAQNELPNNLFLQYYKTQIGYYYGHAQIRNSETCAIIKGDKYKNFNHGIFVDIFPIDNLPDDKKKREYFLKSIIEKKKKFKNYWNCNSDNKIKKVVKKIYYNLYWKFHNIEKELVEFENYVQKYDNYNTKYCGMISFIQDRFIFENEWFDKLEYHKFENLIVKIPNKYDLVLKSSYGPNYMDIPKKKNDSIHGEVFFDTKKSYLEYLNKIDEIEDKL